MLDKLFDEVIAFCETHADPALVQKYSRYFKEGYDAWGVSGPLMDAHRKEIFARDGLAFPMGFYLDLGDKLILHPKYEAKSYALQFAIHFKSDWTLSELQRFKIWFERGISNWGHTDFFSFEGLPVFFRLGDAFQICFAEWRFSSSRWARRAYPVTLIKGLKAGLAPEWALGQISVLMEDPESVVHQATGWFLRECHKIHPLAVEAFLDQWKDRSPRLIIQYATEKMDSQQKARFKRKK